MPIESRDSHCVALSANLSGRPARARQDMFFWFVLLPNLTGMSEAITVLTSTTICATLERKNMKKPHANSAEARNKPTLRNTFCFSAMSWSLDAKHPGWSSCGTDEQEVDSLYRQSSTRGL